MTYHTHGNRGESLRAPEKVRYHAQECNFFPKFFYLQIAFRYVPQKENIR